LRIAFLMREAVTIWPIKIVALRIAFLMREAVTT
jgi:hypothetical protein